LGQVDIGDQAIGQTSELSTSHQPFHLPLKQHL
jgi:hypothetical protein